MDRPTVLVRILASGLIMAVAAAILIWFWPREAEVTPLHVAVVALSAIMATVVLVSLWRK